jgi:hypothetical protein
MLRCDDLYVWPRGDAAAGLRAILAVDHPAVLSLAFARKHASGTRAVRNLKRRVRKTRENPISLLDEAASVTLCRIHCALLG